jgi:4-amino-4-deoxy-L-arabinose transferase-like glycosyltransferase
VATRSSVPLLAARIIAGTALLAGAVYVVALFTSDPMVWPDEAVFANPAVNLVRHGYMGTDLMTGYMRGIEAHTYWQPPLYFVLLAVVFAVAGVSVEAMRGFSVLAAVAVLAATWRLGRRVGLGPAAACVPVALLAVDGVFLRAARLGRMDLLAIGLTLFAWERALAYEDDARARDATLAGLLAGLAAITHPLGLAAIGALGMWWLWTRKTAAPVVLVRALAGFVVPVALWGLYVLRDPGGFAAQLGGSIARKAGRNPWSASFLWRSLQDYLGQYRDASNPTAVDPHLAAAVVWGVGTLGLLWGARANRRMRLLLVGQLLLGIVILSSSEMWYAVYFVPTVALGVGALFSAEVFDPPDRQMALALVAAACAWFAVENLMRQEALRARWAAAGESAHYDAFCARVGAFLPSGATVFVSVLPDVYLGLTKRPDLRFRSFAPEGVPLPRGAERSSVAAVDYVITGPQAPGTVADIVGPREGTLVGEVGHGTDGYRARIFRMPHAGA